MKEVICVDCRLPLNVYKTMESKALDSNLDYDSDMIKDAVTVCKDTGTKLHQYICYEKRCKNRQNINC